MRTGVSHETDALELGIYGRLYEWAVWATDRHELTERHDDVAAGFRITKTIHDRLAESRRRAFPQQCEAIDRTVASLKLEHDDMMLNHLLRKYFLEWKTVETIAIEENMSEHHVTEYLQRALRLVARKLPRFDLQGPRC